MNQLSDKLVTHLKQFKHMAIAFSGGVDSTVVAKAAYLAVEEANRFSSTSSNNGKRDVYKAIAITADSPSVPRSEIESCIQIAQEIGIEHRIVSTDEFQNPSYLQNDGSRCYFCKSTLYQRIRKELSTDSQWIICSGANLDDLGDYRPGLTAAAELGIRHPLIEVGFRKAEIRELASYWQLPNSDKPASPCLSSRIVPGVMVTRDRVAKIEAAEAWLVDQGLTNCRVRLHENDLARIEIPIDQIPRFAIDPLRSQLVDFFRQLGFAWVTIDFNGLQSGGMNHLIPLEIKQKFTKIPNPF